MYAFLGISLATQDYINPSIDIIKKKGVVSRSFEPPILILCASCGTPLALIRVHECDTFGNDELGSRVIYHHELHLLRCQ